MTERRLPLLVDPDTLAANLDMPALLILDVSSPERYSARHIPGAVNLPYPAILRSAPPAMGLLPDETALSQVLSAVGLTEGSHVVAYDGEGNASASRLLWTLEALGHQNYSLLDGGLVAWHAEGHELESGENRPTPSGYHARVRNPDVVADKGYVLDHLADANVTILDARTPDEYSGADVRAARGGHIPGAINLDWTEAIDRGNNLRLQPVATLRALLKNHGVTPDREIVTHCQTHHRSAHTFLVLKYLGYPRVRGYDGSWSEWGNDPEVPVER